MKKLLITLLFLTAPALQSSVEFYIEQCVVIPESDLRRYVGLNLAYAQMFVGDPVAQAYFVGKAESYHDMLTLLLSRAPGTP